MRIGLGISIHQAGIKSQIDNFKGQAQAIGATVNNDALAIYASLSKAMVSKPGAVTFIPYAYKGNTVYGMDTVGNMVAFTCSRSSNATNINKAGQMVDAGTSPRFRYVPAAGAYIGLYLEQAATNSFVNSDPTSAENYQAAVTYATQVWPHTSLMSNAVVYANNAVIRARYGGTAIASTLTCFSCFVKMNDNSMPVVSASTSTGDFCISINDGTVTNFGVIDYGNGVYRVYGSLTTGSSQLGNNGIIKYTTQSAKGFVCSGFQLETGNYPTSYIPTAGATATRARDVFTSNTDLLTDVAGTVMTWFAHRKYNSNISRLASRGTDDLGRILLDSSSVSTSITLRTYDGTTTLTDTNGNISPGTFTKSIVSYSTAANAFKFCRDNLSVVSAGSYDGTFGSGGGNLINFNSNINAGILYMAIKALIVFPSPVSDAEAQNFTA